VYYAFAATGFSFFLHPLALSAATTAITIVTIITTTTTIITSCSFSLFYIVTVAVVQHVGQTLKKEVNPQTKESYFYLSEL
jgi:hypothetical protein